MSALPRTEGRRGLVPFRLSDVPISIRRVAANHLIRVAHESADPWSAITLTRAAETPSDRVYWIPAQAYDDVRSKRAWR